MPDDAERKAAAKAVKAVQKEFLRQTSYISKTANGTRTTAR